MTDADPLFIDTDILIHANVAAAPLHQQALAALQAADRAGRTLWINRQVIREFIALRSRADTFPLAGDGHNLVHRVRFLEKRFRVADDTASVTARLIELVHEFQLAGSQVHDANIIATMQAFHIPALLTHNARDFARFKARVRIEVI